MKLSFKISVLVLLAITSFSYMGCTDKLEEPELNHDPGRILKLFLLSDMTRPSMIYGVGRFLNLFK